MISMIDVARRNVLAGVIGFFLAINLAAPALVLADANESNVREPGQIVRVLQLNFNSETWSTDFSQRLRDLRFKRLVKWARQNDPDIIMIQEGWNFHKNSNLGTALGKVLNMDVAYRLDLGFPGLMMDGDTILAKKKFHMSDEVDTKLPHSAVSIGDGKKWTIGFGAVSYSVSVHLTLDDGEPLYVATTHLVGSTDPDRADQITAAHAAVLAQMRNHGDTWEKAHVIFAGDTNSEPTSPAITYMIGQGYRDTWQDAHPGDESCTNCGDWTQSYFNPMELGPGIFPSQAGPGDQTNTRIDYVLAHGPGETTVASTLTFSTAEQGIWMTDHYGVFATLSYGGAKMEVANPVHDHPDTLLPAFLDVTRAVLECVPENGSCVRVLPDMEVEGARGLVVRNATDEYVYTSILGRAKVLTRSWITLDKAEAAAFAFTAPGTYELKLTVDRFDVTNVYVARVHVHAGDWFPTDSPWPKGRSGDVPALAAIQ